MVYNYSKDFYIGQMHGSSLAARKILPIVFEQLSAVPKSVVDVGCGIGPWLEACEHFGINDYIGLDGNYVNRDLLLLIQINSYLLILIHVLVWIELLIW